MIMPKAKNASQFRLDKCRQKPKVWPCDEFGPCPEAAERQNIRHHLAPLLGRFRGRLELQWEVLRLFEYVSTVE